MVEFALTFLLFVLIVMGVLDFGRAIYQGNGVSEAARDLARVTSVHPGTPGGALGSSSQTAAVLATQRSLVWSLANPTYTCVDIAGATILDHPCRSGDWVRVSITAQYTPITPPIVWLVGNRALSSSSSIQIP